MNHSNEKDIGFADPPTIQTSEYSNTSRQPCKHCRNKLHSCVGSTSQSYKHVFHQGCWRTRVSQSWNPLCVARTRNRSRCESRTSHRSASFLPFCLQIQIRHTEVNSVAQNHGAIRKWHVCGEQQFSKRVNRSSWSLALIFMSICVAVRFNKNLSIFLKSRGSIS